MTDLMGQIRSTLHGVATGQAQERVNLGAFIIENALKELHADDAQTRLAAVRLWMERQRVAIQEWMKAHNPDCECEVGQTTLDVLAGLRMVLDGEVAS